MKMKKRWHEHPTERYFVTERLHEDGTPQHWNWSHGWTRFPNDDLDFFYRPIGITTYEDTWCEPEDRTDWRTD
jgi:hypothetical protein